MTRRRPPGPVVALFVAVLALAACGSADGAAETAGTAGEARSDIPAEVPDAAEVGEVTVTGEALPELTGTGADPAIGQDAPRVTGTGLNGGEVTIGDGGGPQVVAVVAHWCPHCQREVPKLADWMADGGLPDGMDMVAVSTAQQPDGPNWPPSDWLRDEGWTAPVLADSSGAQAAAALGVSGFPFFVLIDGDGTVVDRFSGEISTDELSGRIDTALTS